MNMRERPGKRQEGDGHPRAGVASGLSRHIAALKTIAYMRPAGECKNKMIQKMERAALEALDYSRPAEALAWCSEIFGPVARQTDERACRFIEEAIELVQATGIPAATIAKITERVYSRPAGDLRKEVGQAAITLELLAQNVGLSADDEAASEFQRVQAIPKEEWKRRHDAKVALGIASN